MAQKYGIDVSNHNGNIDWSQVATEKSFIIVRAGYGDLNGVDTHIDIRAVSYIQGAQQYNIAIAGIYWYSYTRTAAYAEIEAKRACKFLSDNGWNVPVYFDFELAYEGYTNTPEEVRSFCTAFTNEVKKEGYTAGVYFDPNYYSQYYGSVFIDNLRANGVKIWYAAWYLQQPDIDCDVWQYSSTGIVSGITGNVDLNQILNNIDYINTNTDYENKKIKIEDGFFYNLDYLSTYADTYTMTEDDFKKLKDYYDFKIGITQRNKEVIVSPTALEPNYYILFTEMYRPAFNLQGLKLYFDAFNSHLLFKTQCSNYFNVYKRASSAQYHNYINLDGHRVTTPTDYCYWVGLQFGNTLYTCNSLNEEINNFNIEKLYSTITFFEWNKPDLEDYNNNDSSQDIKNYFYYFKWGIMNYFKVYNTITDYYYYDEINERYHYYIIDIYKLKFGIKCNSQNYIYWNDRDNNVYIWSDNDNIFIPNFITSSLYHRVSFDHPTKYSYVDYISQNYNYKIYKSKKLKTIYYSRVF